MAKKLSAYNRYMRAALKGKMKGKTKAQRKTIFKAAARGWKKESKTRKRIKTGAMKRATTRYRSRPKTKTKTRSNPTVSKRRGFLTTSTFYKFARLAALVGPAAVIATGPGTAQAKIQAGLTAYTGMDASGGWSLGNLARGWLPFIGTSLVTHGISKVIGMIRRL